MQEVSFFSKNWTFVHFDTFFSKILGLKFNDFSNVFDNEKMIWHLINKFYFLSSAASSLFGQVCTSVSVFSALYWDNGTRLKIRGELVYTSSSCGGPNPAGLPSYRVLPNLT